MGEVVSRSLGHTVLVTRDSPGPSTGLETQTLIPMQPCPGRVCVFTRSRGGSSMNDIVRSSVWSGWLLIGWHRSWVRLFTHLGELELTCLLPVGPDFGQLLKREVAQKGLPRESEWPWHQRPVWPDSGKSRDSSRGLAGCQQHHTSFFLCPLPVQTRVSCP